MTTAIIITVMVDRHNAPSTIMTFKAPLTIMTFKEEARRMTTTGVVGTTGVVVRSTITIMTVDGRRRLSTGMTEEILVVVVVVVVVVGRRTFITTKTAIDVISMVGMAIDVTLMAVMAIDVTFMVVMVIDSRRSAVAVGMTMAAMGIGTFRTAVGVAMAMTAEETGVVVVNLVMIMGMDMVADVVDMDDIKTLTKETGHGATTGANTGTEMVRVEVLSGTVGRRTTSRVGEIQRRGDDRNLVMNIAAGITTSPCSSNEDDEKLLSFIEPTTRIFSLQI